MTTFLQLAKFVASKSGTISGDLPLTVVNQAARLKKVVDCTAIAWRMIQTLHNNWGWMRKDFTSALTIGNTHYSGLTFSITDFSRWVTEYGTVTLYDPAIGVADESDLRKITWQEWRLRYGQGTQTPARPSEYAIGPNNEMRIQNPDKAYVLRGEYMTVVQNLALDADVPLLPADYHDLIGWRGLLVLAEDDEAVTQIQTATVEYSRLLGALESTQLPEVYFPPDPLA